MAILRTQASIAEATMADLVETYNALSGKSIKKFENRVIAERRVEAAMLAAKDADAHTGVPKGASGQVKTREEIVQKAAAKGVPAPPAPDSEDIAFPPGSLADGLSRAAKAAAPIAARAKKERTASAGKATIFAVQATFAGTSKPQVGSVRNNVLLRVQASENNATTIASLDKHFETDTRGYVQKLIEKNHLKVLNEEQFSAARPTKKPQ